MPCKATMYSGHRYRDSKRLTLELERLEDRRLLAGNVTVVQTAAGDIRITGDNDGSFVELEPDANGDLFIDGVGTTTVNGSSSLTIVLSTPFTIDGNLTANMRGGLDKLTMQGINVNGRISVNLGPAPDGTVLFPGRFRFLDGAAGDDVIVRAGSGNEEVVFRNAIIDGDVRVTTGGGIDRVEFDGTTVVGKADLRLGAGNDAVGLFDSAADLWSVSTVSGEDVLAFFHTTGDMNVKMGSGSDVVWGGGCSTVGTSSWNLGSGDLNFAMFENQFAGPMTLRSGGGTDYVFLPSATFMDSFSMNLGGGADGVFLRTTTTFAAPGGMINAGGGTDAIVLETGFNNSSDITFSGFDADLFMTTTEFDDMTNNAKNFPVMLWIEAGGDFTKLTC